MNTKRFFIVTVGLLFCILGCTRDPVGVIIPDDIPLSMEVHEPADIEISFEQHIMPILTAKCALAGCHVADGPDGLDFRTYESFIAGGEHGPVFIPGNAGESEVIEEIVEGKMPPPPRDPLSTAEIQLFRDWINQQETQDVIAHREHGDDHDDMDDGDVDDHDDMDDDEHDDDMDDDHDGMNEDEDDNDN